MRLLFKLVQIVLVLAIFVIASSIFLSPNDLNRCLDNNIRPGSLSDCQPADAIVAISGGNTNARTMHAVSLYSKGWSSNIIFSGAAADAHSPSNASVMRDQAQIAGVPPSVIVIEEKAKNTIENAELTSEIIINRDYKKIILVTSGYHQRRAYLEFSRALKNRGVEIINSPTEDTDWSNMWWLRPRGWRLVISELVGIIAFYARSGAVNG